MAANNKKGITLVISGETTDLQKALKKPEADAKSLRQELSAINGSLKFNPDSLELLAQKSEVLGKEITAVSEKLRIMKEAQSQVEAQAATGDIGEEQYRTFQRELIKTEDILRTLQDQLKGNGAAIQTVGDQTQAVTGDSAAFEKALQKQKQAVDSAKSANDTHGQSVRKLRDDYTEAQAGATSFSDVVSGTAIGSMISSGIQEAGRALLQFAADGAQAAKDFEVDQQKLTTALRNTIGATQDNVNAIMDLIEQEEQLGVVSKEAQTAAAQELATYVTRRGVLEKLIPALNNMIVQQNGVNASAQSTISVATAVGKTLDGQVGSLQRWGYRFTEAEQRILHGNNEMRKAQVIIDSVNSSVGGMNYTMRQTTEEGRLFAASLEIGGVQEEFGKNVESIKNNLQIQMLPTLITVTKTVNEFVQKNGNAIEAFGSIIVTVANAISNLIAIVSLLPPELITLISFILLAVKAYTEMKKALTPTQEALKAMGKTMKVWEGSADGMIVKVIAVIAALSLLLFLILAIKEGTESASRSMDSLGNVKVPSVPNVPGYARGTRNAQRGAAWVGEEGPELVFFRGGETVTPARQSTALAASGAAGTGTSYGDYNDMRQYHIGQLNDMKDLLDAQANARRRGRARGNGVN